MAQGIKLTRFGGMAPRFAPELLPEGFGQTALNCKIASGDLIPYNGPQFLLDATVSTPLALYPIVNGTDFYWMMWQTDVDIVRSPVSSTSGAQKFYFTGDGVPKATDVNRATFLTTSTKVANYTVVEADYETTIKYDTAPFTVSLLAAATAGNQFVIVVHNAAASGDITIDADGAELIDGAATIAVAPGTRRKIKSDGTGWTSTLLNGYPYDTFSLGVPAPASPCTIAYDTLAKAAAYTVVAADTLKTIDCTATPWSLGLTAAATLGSSFMVVVRNLGTGDLTVDPNGSELINDATTLIIRSGEVGVITCNGTAFAATLISGSFKSYVYTYVTEWGEESMPSSSSNLLLLTSGQRVNVSGLPATPPAGEFNVKTYRLYRSNTGDTGTAYQFIVEQDIGTTTYADTIVDAALGEALPSSDYQVPPTDLKGIVNMANGMTVGFHGNELCFAEPYEPHAWPLEYRYSVDFPIVAIGAVGNSLVVTTEGRPYIASGNHPSTISVYPLDLPYPCLSKRGLINMGTGIMYPSYEGLVFVPGANPTLASVQVFTRDEWSEYSPTTLFAAFYDGKYFGNYETDGVNKSFIFQNATDRIAMLVHTNIWASASYSDSQTGEYFFIQNDKLYQWDSPDERFALQEWHSKDFVFDKPVNMGVAQIYADFTGEDYTEQNIAIVAANEELDDELGEMGGVEFAAEVEVAGDLYESLLSPSGDAQVLFQLYVDKELKWERYVTSSRPFRLPTGYKSDTVSVKVSARLRVHAVLVAETPTALEQLNAA